MYSQEIKNLQQELRNGNIDKVVSFVCQQIRDNLTVQELKPLKDLEKYVKRALSGDPTIDIEKYIDIVIGLNRKKRIRR